MEEQITIVEREAISALSIFASTTTLGLGRIMGPAYKEIMERLETQQLPPGTDTAPFTVYRDLTWDALQKKGLLAAIRMMLFTRWHVEMGIPCPEGARGGGRVVTSEITAGRYIRAIHTGPYHKVGESYRRVMEWAREKKLTVQNRSVEFYLNDPRNTPARDLKTELLIPIK